MRKSWGGVGALAILFLLFAASSPTSSSSSSTPQTPTPPKPPPTPAPTPKRRKTVTMQNIVATFAAALRQAAQEKGHSLDDNFIAMVIGQLRGAEGGLPGLATTFAGTNNPGALQVTKAFRDAHQGEKGFGAFAHKDSDQTGTPYIGWYIIVPTPLDSARAWLSGSAGAQAVLRERPATSAEYARIMYLSRYFSGQGHGVDPADEPHATNRARNADSPPGSLYVADYAKAIERGRPTAAELALPPGDVNEVTVDPSKFASTSHRGITAMMFTRAKGGGLGSAWSYLLPATFDELVASNGVVWFGTSPDESETSTGDINFDV